MKEGTAEKTIHPPEKTIKINPQGSTTFFFYKEVSEIGQSASLQPEVTALI